MFSFSPVRGLARQIIPVLILTSTTFSVKAQCDSTADATGVYTALKMDQAFPFATDVPFYLEARLDNESLGIIKQGISKAYYVRQRDEGDHIEFDTIRLAEAEKKLLSDLFTPLSGKIWTPKSISFCKIPGNEVTLYRKDKETKGLCRTSYQVMEPMFLRDHTLAFAYYKRTCPDKYAEFSLLTKEGNKWVLWYKIIIVIG